MAEQLETFPEVLRWRVRKPRSLEAPGPAPVAGWWYQVGPCLLHQCFHSKSSFYCKWEGDLWIPGCIPSVPLLSVCSQVPGTPYNTAWKLGDLITIGLEGRRRAQERAPPSQTSLWNPSSSSYFHTSLWEHTSRWNNQSVLISTSSSAGSHSLSLHQNGKPPTSESRASVSWGLLLSSALLMSWTIFSLRVSLPRPGTMEYSFHLLVPTMLLLLFSRSIVSNSLWPDGL